MVKRKTAEEKYQEAEVKAQKHLENSAKALRAMCRLANEAGYDLKGLDDGRVLLAERCYEFQSYLWGRIDRRAKTKG